MSTASRVTTTQNVHQDNVSDEGSRATPSQAQKLSPTIEELLRTYPALDALGRLAQLEPFGHAAEYFRELAAATVSGNPHQLRHVLASAGVL